MKKSPNFQIPDARFGGKTPTKVVERNLMAAKPTDKNQMAPTPESPVRAHYKMAGGQ